MAHMVKIQKWVNNILESQNHFIASFEDALAYIENYPEAHCRIFDENGEHKHERHPVGTVKIDVPVSLSTTIV